METLPTARVRSQKKDCHPDPAVTGEASSPFIRARPKTTTHVVDRDIDDHL
jgi:hypothetical protein